jgi:hypothetical protein
VLAGRDQGGAAEPVGDRRVGSAVVGELENVEVPFGAGVQKGIVKHVVLNVRVSPTRKEEPDGSDLVRVGRRHRRGPSAFILHIDVAADIEFALDAGEIALHCVFDQCAHVFLSSWWDLHLGSHRQDDAGGQPANSPSLIRCGGPSGRRA